MHSDAGSYFDFYLEDGGAWTTKDNDLADESILRSAGANKAKGWSNCDSATATAMTNYNSRKRMLTPTKTNLKRMATTQLD